MNGYQNYSHQCDQTTDFSFKMHQIQFRGPLARFREGREKGGKGKEGMGEKGWRRGREERERGRIFLVISRNCTLREKHYRVPAAWEYRLHWARLMHSNSPALNLLNSLHHLGALQMRVKHEFRFRWSRRSYWSGAHCNDTSLITASDN